MTSPAHDGNLRVPWPGGFTLVQWEEVGFFEINLGKILSRSISKRKTIIRKNEYKDWTDVAMYLTLIGALSVFVSVGTIT